MAIYLCWASGFNQVHSMLKGHTTLIDVLIQSTIKKKKITGITEALLKKANRFTKCCIGNG